MIFAVDPATGWQNRLISKCLWGLEKSPNDRTEDSETLELDRNEQVDLADNRSMRVVVPLWKIRIYSQEQAPNNTDKAAQPRSHAPIYRTRTHTSCFFVFFFVLSWLFPIPYRKIHNKCLRFNCTRKWRKHTLRSESMIKWVRPAP